MTTGSQTSAASKAVVGETGPAGLKICLVSTSGGHLRQLAQIEPALRGVPSYLVTVDSPDASWTFPSMRKYLVHRVMRNPMTFLVNAIESLRVLIKERPSGIITTGAGDALPTVILAAGLGIPIMFVESVARVRQPSLFGRIAAPFARVTVIQWRDLKSSYPYAILATPMIAPFKETGGVPPRPTIVLLTGTHVVGFERLLRVVDELLRDGKLEASVFGQIGHSRYTPTRYPFVRFLPHDELMTRLQSADVVVTHDGSGSIADGLAAGKPVIVVPRRAAEGELSYKSDSDLARHLSRLGWITLVDDPYALPLHLNGPFAGLSSLPDIANPSVADVARMFIDSISAKRMVGVHDLGPGARKRRHTSQFKG